MLKTYVVCVIFVNKFPNVATAKETPRNHQDYGPDQTIVGPYRRALEGCLEIDRKTSSTPPVDRRLDECRL